MFYEGKWLPNVTFFFLIIIMISTCTFLYWNMVYKDKLKKIFREKGL